jgi:protein phosphatase
VGLKRSHNEDSLCADPELALFLVCDGMGGRNAGEVASQLTVEMIQTHMREARYNKGLPLIGEYDPKFSPRTNRLASAIRLANEVVYGASRSNPDQAGMGTTVVAAVITDQVLSVAHVGDSRLYLLRGDEIQSLTTDHSLVAEQVRRGLLTEEEAEESPQRNIVTRALGVEHSVEVELDELQLFPGDTLLLCSDGLTRSVKPAEILKLVQSEAEPQAACERLVESANAAGGDDNTTVIQLNVRKTVPQGFWKRLWKRVGRSERPE